MRSASTLLFILFIVQGFAQTTATRSALEPLTYGVILDHPDMKKVAVKQSVPYMKTEKGDLHADVYLPPNADPTKKYPAIIFLNALGDREGQTKMKDWAVYTTWPTLMAAHGYVGISMEASAEKIQESISGLFDFIAEKGSDFYIDPEKLGIYAASANVGGSFQYLMNSSASKGIKAAVLYYGMSPEGPFRKDLPVLFVVSEGDRQHTDYSKLWTEVLKNNAPWTIMMATGMPHAFDVYADNDRSRQIVKETISFWKNNLDPVPQPSFGKSIGREIFANLGTNNEKALELLKKVTDENPKDVYALNMYGHHLYRLQRYIESRKVYEKLLAADESNLIGLVNIAATYYATGDAAAAQQYVNKAESTGKMKRDEYSQLGFILLVANKNEEAADMYSKAVSFEAIPVDYYNLACAYAKSNHTEKAFEALERSIQMGYGPKQHIATDGDLASLRTDKRFTDLLEKVR